METQKVFLKDISEKHVMFSQIFPTEIFVKLKMIIDYSQSLSAVTNVI